MASQERRGTLGGPSILDPHQNCLQLWSKAEHMLFGIELVVIQYIGITCPTKESNVNLLALDKILDFHLATLF